MTDRTLSHVIAAKVASGDLGVRLGLSDQELAVIQAVLGAGAPGWRAFECETLDADGTYVGVVRLTTHPAVGATGAAAGIAALDPGSEDAVPAAAQRRKRPPSTPAQARVRAALDRAKSDLECQNSDLEPLENLPQSVDSPETSIA